VSLSQTPSRDGSDQHESWESCRKELQDAFVAGSTTELSQSALQLNQHGNTVRLMALYGNDLRFCPPMKKWFRFTGTHWAPDEKGVVRTLAKDTVFQFLHQALTAKNSKAIDFAIESLCNGPINAMLKGAEAALAVMPEELDCDPYALNFTNCTVDLRTATTRPHTREDLITMVLGHNYDPAATCPMWDASLLRAMGGGSGASATAQERAALMTEYIETALGYSLSADPGGKAFFMACGASGNNGKTTMLSLVRELAGPYGTIIQVERLLQRNDASNNAQSDLADLRGKRFVQTSEVSTNARLSAGALKRMVQGYGTMKAARKYENMIEFKETYHIWLDSNPLPEIDSDDQALCNRLHPIPFTVTIPDDQIDRDMPQKLLAEGPGILAKLVAGAVRYFKSGLQRPEEVSVARAEWREEFDVIGRFIEERCTLGDTRRIQASALYNAFTEWRRTEGEKGSMSQTDFGGRLRKRGIERRRPGGQRFYFGIGMKGEEGALP
jgi:putative DNA primase/helicase